MPTPVILPKLGMTMVEGTVTEWYMQSGDEVSPGDLLFAFETEKVNYDVEAEAAGTLHVVVEVDTTVDPGAVVGYLLAAGEQPPAPGAPPPPPTAAAAASPQPEPSTPVAAPAVPAAGGNGAGGDGTAGGRASPAVKRLAEEHGIDLTAVSGSGVGGRILREDVVAAVRAGEPAAATLAPARVKASPAAKRIAGERGVDLATVAGSGPGGRIVVEDVEATADRAGEPAEAEAPVTASTEAESIPFRGMRRTIASRMHESLQSTAQLTMAMDVDMTRAVALRKELIDVWKDRGLRPTYTDFVIKAVALALREHPRVNAGLREDQIILHPKIHVGFAVALDEGLIVPVTRNSDARPLDKLAPETADLAARARDNALTPDDLTGGTFTVTSLGMFGVDVFTPIINPPQAAILGVGRIFERPVFASETGTEIERRSFLTLSLTIDHRILDGAPGAEFLRSVTGILERPSQLLLD